MLSTRPTAWVNERSTSLDVYGSTLVSIYFVENLSVSHRPLEKQNKAFEKSVQPSLRVCTKPNIFQVKYLHKSLKQLKLHNPFPFK